MPDDSADGRGRLDGQQPSRVAWALVWSAARVWGGRVLSLVLYLSLARLLAPEAFGIIAAAMIPLALVQALRSFGLEKALVQSPTLEESDLATAFRLLAFAGILAGVLLVGLAVPLESLVGLDGLAPVVAALSGVALISGLGGVPAAILSRDLRFDALARRDLTATLVSGAAAIALAAGGAGVWALVGQQLLQAAVSLLLSWGAIEWRPQGLARSERFSPSIQRTARHILGLDLLEVLTRYADDALVARRLGGAALGYYNMGFRLSTMSVELFTTAASSVTLPVLVQRTGRDRADAHLVGMGLMATVAMPAMLLVAVLASPIVATLLGERWLPAADVIAALAIVGVLRSVLDLTGATVMAAGGSATLLRMRSVNAAMTVAAAVLAVPHGYVALSWALVVRSFLMVPLHVKALHRWVGISTRDLLGAVLPPAGAAGAAAAVAALTHDLMPGPGLGRLGVAAAVGALVFLFVLRRYSPDHFGRLVSFLETLRPRRSLPASDPSAET